LTALLASLTALSLDTVLPAFRQIFRDLAMQSMGRIAGLGSSIIASLSSLVAVIFSAFSGSLYDDSTLNLAVAIFLAASVSFSLVLIVEKKTTNPI